MPAEANSNINKIEEEIKSKINPQKISKEPVAFGIVSIVVTKLVEDAEGELEKVENALHAIDGVGEVEVVEITRSL